MQKIISLLFAVATAMLLFGCGETQSSIAKKVTIDGLYRVAIMKMAVGGFVPTPDSPLDSQRRDLFRNVCRKENLPLHTPLEKLLTGSECFDQVKYDVKSFHAGDLIIYQIDFVATKVPRRKDGKEVSLLLTFTMMFNRGSFMEIVEARGRFSFGGESINLMAGDVIDLICMDLAFPEKSELMKKIRAQ